MSNITKSAKSASSPRVGIFISSSAKGSVPSSGGSTAITYITSGQTLNPLTAPAGIYYVEEGAILRNGPNGAATTLYNAMITVRIQGKSINAVIQGLFGGSSSNDHIWTFEFFLYGTAKTAKWDITGLTRSYTADADFTMAPHFPTVLATQDIPSPGNMAQSLHTNK